MDLSWLQLQFTLYFVQSFLDIGTAYAPYIYTSNIANVTCKMGVVDFMQHYYLSVYFHWTSERTNDLIIQYTDVSENDVITNDTKWLDGKSCQGAHTNHTFRLTCALWKVNDEYYIRKIRVVNNKTVVLSIDKVFVPYKDKVKCFSDHGVKNLTTKNINLDSIIISFSTYSHDEQDFLEKKTVSYSEGNTQNEIPIWRICSRNNCDVFIAGLRQCTNYKICVNLFTYSKVKYTKCMDIQTLCLPKKPNKDITILKASVSAIGGGLVLLITAMSTWILLTKMGICSRNVYPRFHGGNNDRSEELSDYDIRDDSDSMNHIYQSIPHLVKKIMTEENKVLFDEPSSNDLNGDYQTVEQSGLNTTCEVEDSTEQHSIPQVFVS